MKYAPIPIETERVATETIGAAIEVLRHLRPGFLEKIHQEALCLELSSRRLRVGLLLNFHEPTLRHGFKRIVC